MLDLTSVTNQFTNLTNVQWIIVTFGLGLGVDDIGIFPCLRGVSDMSMSYSAAVTYSWECTVVPEVTFVGEAVANKSKLSFLHILLDWVARIVMSDRGLYWVQGRWESGLEDSIQEFFFGDLYEKSS